MSVETSPSSFGGGLAGALPRPKDDVVEWEFLLTGVVLIIALLIGLLTAADYGVSIDEFNADDYGPKALAWYTSGFTDRSHFENVEWTLWYYGPWFHILTAMMQALDLGDRFAVRHAMTFLAGIGGIAALLPIGRLAGGRWTGLTTVALCLLTGYLYGSLFFTPIDVPFLAAMTWATLAILVMTREALPSLRMSVVAGLATGLAIATRTGGIITHAYLVGALILCAAEEFAASGRLTARYIFQLASRYVATVIIAALTTIALWPWLQIGNPFTQFMIAFRHFGNMSMSMSLPHWGQEVSTQALPLTYIPAQLAARLPEAFLLLLTVAMLFGLAAMIRLGRTLCRDWPADRTAALRSLVGVLARHRAIIVVATTVILPVGYMMAAHTVHYDGVRHVLFIIPMLAVLAGAGFSASLPHLRRAASFVAAAIALYVGYLLLTLALLHPLEYVAMNALAGGTRGAYGRFELDYFTVAPTTALRRLERRLDADPSIDWAANPPSILVCIPWREHMVGPILKRPWRIAPDAARADFLIESERWRCAEGLGLKPIDEVRRLGVGFASTYARRPLKP